MAGKSFFGRIMGRDQSETQAAVPVSQVNSAPQDDKTYEFNTRLGSSYLNVVNYGTKCTAPYSTEEITRMARDPMQYISELRQWAKWAYYSNGTVTTAIDMVKKFGYPISGISDHAESYRAGYGSNHGDVGQWWPKHGKSMDALRKEVQEILNGETEDDDMDVARFKELWGEMRKELQDNDASAYSAEAREWATKNGLIAGNGTTVNGEPNCMWGDILTREQFVTVLYRWTQMMGKA